MTWLDYWKNIFESIKLLVYLDILGRFSTLSIKRLELINKIDRCMLKMLRKTRLRYLRRFINNSFMRRNRRFIKATDKFWNRHNKQRSIHKRLDEIRDEQESFLWINYGIRL